MKKINLLIATIVLLMSVFARADLRLEFIGRSGYVMREDQYSIKCEFFDEHIRIEGQKADQEPVFKYVEYKITDEIMALITQASEAEITSRLAPADIGWSVYTAYRPLSIGKTLMIDLGSTRDSISITQNHSPSAEKLKLLIDQYCKL